MKEKKKLFIVVSIFIILVILIFLLLRGCNFKKFIVTFDSDGGTIVEAVKVKANHKVLKPEDPIKNGYTFAGWYYLDELFDFDTKITKDITLKAHWTLSGIVLKTTLINMVKGSTKQIEFVSLPSEITLADLVYSSSDESIVTVDEIGLLKALKKGTVVITVKTKDGKYEAKCKVNVTEKEIEVTSITLSGENTVTVGSKIKLTVLFNPSNATDTSLTWNVSDETLAEVNEYGEVTGLKPGKVTVTATTKNGKTATHEVTIKEASATIFPTGITISGPTEVLVNDTIQLVARVLPNNATNKTVTWKVSDETLAKVDSSGKVTGLKAGTVTIFATTVNGYQATYEVKILVKEDSYELHLKSILISGINATYQYTCTVLKNGSKFNDFKGFTINNHPYKNGSTNPTVAATHVNAGSANSATITLQNGDLKNLTVIFD